MRAKLSSKVDMSALKRLRATDLSAVTPGSLQSLLERAGVASVKPVHSLSAAEVTDDKYGFAREFSLTMTKGTDVDAAIAMLAASDFFDDIRPVRIRRTSST